MGELLPREPACAVSLNPPAAPASGFAGLPPPRVTAGLLLLVLVGSLVVYKSAGALRQLDQARVTRSVAARPALVADDSASRPVRIAARTINYLDAVWPALVFGVLISGAVRAFAPVAALSRFVDRGGLRSQLAAGASGAPLMLCSCCVAPIFSSVYERSHRLAPSLAVMIAAPALNPAALVLTFLLFPAQVAWARLWMSIAAVIAGTLLVARFSGRAPRGASSTERDSSSRRPGDALGVLRFVQATMQVAARTVPIVLIGVVTAVLLADSVPLEASLLPSTRLLAIAVTALIALPIALPTFFEIPLATALVASGAPAGAAAALLFVGPAVNLPSLLTVGRAAGWQAALLVASMVWTVAVLGGLVLR